MEFELESELALKAVSSVSESLLNRPDKLLLSTKATHRELVTDLDVAVENRIREILRPSGHPVVGEESYFKNTDKNLPTAPYWCVDPIDGTVNYVCGLPLFAVSVGFIFDRFMAGAISLPALKELYFTLGKNAFLNGRKLKVEDAPLSKSVVVECFSAPVEDEIRYKQQLNLFRAFDNASRGCLRLGSAAASLCYVASGNVQAVCGIQSELWDVAAGLAIASRAGCKIYLSRIPNSTKINFIAGTPCAAEELYKMCIYEENLVLTPYAG